MSEFIAFVKRENVMKADNRLKEDFDVASKQSITIRDAKTLGIDRDGSFFLISGTEEGVEKCKELLKEFIENVPEQELEKAKEAIKKGEESAAVGMGSIFG
ncbi:MAG: hypothetical protein J7K26_02805 [Candidatus Aenigmarchaeota archaeon]|nr:hypothetical protein [Candidatus Aenigmarchaeota archaeon]